MSGFTASWLALREPHDARARAPQAVAVLGPAAVSTAAPRAVVDLGAGSGANFRYLAPRLGGAQTWTLVDHDDALLDAAEHALRDWAAERRAEAYVDGDADDGGGPRGAGVLRIRGADVDCRVRRTRLDLATSLDRLDIPRGALVTSSALLDLVSAPWLESLARRGRAAAAALWVGRTEDSRAAGTPAAPEDAEVLVLCKRPQRRDKGFGPALGPVAARITEGTFAAFGYRVHRWRSDWRIEPAATDFQRALISGWHDAAVEIAPQRRAALRGWLQRRLAHVDAGRSELVVGHEDFVARPL
jgi:hypothetical protein